MRAMPDLPEPLKDLKLAQVAIVVHDIAGAKKRWAAALGVEEPNEIVTSPGNEVNMTFAGEPSNAQCKLAFFDVGGVQLELIEPMGGKSTWQDVLDRKGEGMHHIAFWVENMAETSRQLKEHGVQPIQRGDMGEGQYGYFDAEEKLGCVIELLESKRSGDI